MQAFRYFRVGSHLGTRTSRKKRSKCSAKASQMVPQRNPGALKSVPREPHEPPKTTPQEHLVDPWASKRSPGVVLGASGPHFGAPRVSFTLFPLLFRSRSSLVSSLFSSPLFLSFFSRLSFMLSCSPSLLSVSSLFSF